MKKISLVLLIICFCVNLSAFSQENNNIENDDTLKNTINLKKGYDHLVLNLLNNQWLNIKEPVKQTVISVGCDFYFLYQILKNTHNFNFSIGIGMTNYNFHNNSLPFDSVNYVYFEPVMPGYAYYKNKFSVSYLDIPFEINIVSNQNKKNKNIRVNIGGKAGYLVSNYIKYKGEDFRNNTSEIVKFKEYNIHNVMKYHLAVYLRFVYNKIGININYSLTPTFIKNKGVNYIPLSYGVSFSII